MQPRLGSSVFKFYWPRSNWIRSVSREKTEDEDENHFTHVAPETQPSPSRAALVILHERIPDKTGALVLGHQHGNSEIDPEHISVVPVGQRIEGIDEPVPSPGLGIPFPNRAQHLHTIGIKKRQRAARCTRNDAAIELADPRRSSPGLISRSRVRSSNPPEMVAVVGKLLAQRKAELFMRRRCLHRVLKIVGVGVALAAEIEPGLRVLMREQRVVPRNIFQILELDRRPRPSLPCFGRNRMRRRPSASR